ncbi:MAG: hypothetical protein AB8B73_01430 [Ekhidna sp.]
MIYWFIHILVLGALSYLFYQRQHNELSLQLYGAALALKLSAGIILGLIFFYHYGSGDTIAFFEKATQLSNLSISDHLSSLIADGSYATTNHPRDLFFVKIISVITRLNGGSYWITSLYLSFISFVASWYFVVTMCTIFPRIRSVVILSFLFIPSVIFWSSGVLKDTISFAALIFLVAITVKMIYISRRSPLDIFLGLLSLILLLQLKHYLFITYILFAGMSISLHFLAVIKNKMKWIAALVISIVVIGSTQYIHPYLKWERMPQTIVEINTTIADNYTEYDQPNISLDPTWSSIIKASPEALHTGLVRPSILDQTALFGWVHKIENLLLTILMVLSLLLWLKEKPKLNKTLLIPALLSICLLATMLGLTTPNFGTLVRYKNAFMPFLFLIALILPFRYFSSANSEKNMS